MEAFILFMGFLCVIYELDKINNSLNEAMNNYILYDGQDEIHKLH